jgi:MoaA/NifB/PqqE/SkfB family radical SAM enzyme
MNFRRSLERYVINISYSLNPRKPRLMLRLLLNMFQIVALRRQLLRHIDLNVEVGCNLHCKHCFASYFRKNMPLLDIEDYSRIAEECNKLGSVVFQFTGGEPLLNRDLDKMIKTVRPESNLITIATNGTTVTEERIKELKEIGVDVLVFSLDSGIPEEHDSFRGVQGTYDKVIKAVDLCLENKMKVSLGCTVTHKSLRTEGLRKVLDYARKKKLYICLGIVAPAGRAISEDDFLFTKEDSEYLDKKILPEYPNSRRDWETNYWTVGCGAAKEKVYITPYGEVLCCPYIHISFGNVKKESVKTIRERMLRVPELKTYPRICLAAEDRKFIDEFMVPTFDRSEVPIDYAEISESVA